MKSFSSAQLWKVSVSGGLSSHKDSYRFMRIHSVERLSLFSCEKVSVSGILKGKHKDLYRGMRIHSIIQVRSFSSVVEKVQRLTSVMRIHTGESFARSACEQSVRGAHLKALTRIHTGEKLCL